VKGENSDMSEAPERGRLYLASDDGESFEAIGHVVSMNVGARGSTARARSAAECRSAPLERKG